MTSPNTILEVSDLTVDYRSRESRKERVTVIEGLDLSIERGESLGLVGESGSGKSTLALAAAGLIPVSSGSIRFNGTELVGLPRRKRRDVQRELQLVFQNALLSLSPRRTVEWQLHEPLTVHTTKSRSEREALIGETLDALELNRSLLARLPHELSGGQAQRVVLTRALLLEPSLILFDEPTSALDVSVQASVLNLLQQLKTERNLTYLFITHDLGVARHLCDRIAVLRNGTIVELRATADLFADPTHEYTTSLLDASPTV